MLEYILNSLQLGVIRNLPNVEVSEEFIKNTFQEFNKEYEKIRDKIKIPDNKQEFYYSLLLLWRRYWRDIYLMDALYPKLFPLYPEGRIILYEFLKNHYLLNLIIHHFTAQEKKFVEKVSEGTIEQVFTPYSFFKELLDLPKELILLNRKGRILCQLLFYNDKLVNRLLEKLKTKAYDRKMPIKEENSTEYKILLFDHFIELVWRETGALLLDINFIYPIAKFFNKYSMLETINHLKRDEKEYKYLIPHYRQHTYSCGVACLLNIFGTFGILKPNKKLEKEFLKKVAIEGYYGNLTPFIVKLAKEYGLEAYMFMDYQDYLEKTNKLISLKPELKKPVEIFLGGMRDIKWIDKSSFTFDEIADLLRSGRLISYVGMSGEIRHYKLIFGYNLEEKVLYVYDPLGFVFKLEEKNIQKEMRNDISFWGFIVEAPNRKILDIIKEETKEITNIVNNFCHEK